MSSFNFSIVSPEGKLFEKTVSSVNLPGSEGRFGVLEDHMNLVSSIKPGVVKVRFSDSHVEKFVVCDGIVEVKAKSCSLLVEKAIAENEIDSGEFRNLLDEAKSNLAKAGSETERHSYRMEIEFYESGLDF